MSASLFPAPPLLPAHAVEPLPQDPHTRDPHTVAVRNPKRRGGSALRREPRNYGLLSELRDEKRAKVRQPLTRAEKRAKRAAAHAARIAADTAAAAYAAATGRTAEGRLLVAPLGPADRASLLDEPTRTVTAPVVSGVAGHISKSDLAGMSASERNAWKELLGT